MRSLAPVLLSVACSLASLTACSKDDGAGTGSGAPAAGSATAGSAAKKSSGFSASLSAELAKEGSAAPSVPLSTAPAGSGTGSAAPAAATPTASGSAATSKVASAGSAASSSASASKPATTTPPATPAPTPPTTPPPATPPPATAKTARVPVKPPPELAAIKIDLEPNWERDVGEAGTISFVLNVPSTSDTRLFVFHYGYDPADAPNDRDAYMKWLADQKLLSVSLNRQRGAAWYLEGSDGNGAPAFRTLVMYGGKHLVCWGSLYKDAASNPLGDLRDKVVMTAKQICGTMTL